MKPLLFLSILSFSSFLNAQSLLADNIPYPFHEVQKATEGKINEWMILNSGLASLEKRLELIRSAKSHIEVEYFIYGEDEASKIVTQELILAAQRGVKVRILIDKSLAVFVFDEFYAKALAKHNIEVRYYNAAPVIFVSTIQFRNHRKLLSVDDRAAITGGRNIGDDYFDMSPKFNFLDTDVLIEGDIVKTIRLSFDEYFEADITQRPRFPKRPKDKVLKTVNGKPRMVDNSNAVNRYFKRVSDIKKFLTRSEEDQVLVDKIGTIGQEILATHKKHLCPEMTYTTDRPGGSFMTRLLHKYSDDYRFVRKSLYDKISKVDKAVILASPYMINNKYSHSLMDDLLDKKIDIQLYTNSLASTDAIYVAANLYVDVKGWAKSGIRIHVHDGLYMDETPVIDEAVKKAKWGVHTKAHVYEYKNDSEIMIGTYNIDNRSNHYNSEMVVFCKSSPELTAELKENIQSRMNEGFEILHDGQAINKNGERVNTMGASSENKLLMKLITLPSWLLKFLL